METNAKIDRLRTLLTEAASLGVEIVLDQDAGQHQPTGHTMEAWKENATGCFLQHMLPEGNDDFLQAASEFLFSTAEDEG